MNITKSMIDAAHDACLDRVGYALERDQLLAVIKAALLARAEAQDEGAAGECENCDGEGWIEYEGGDGEGWPSKPERDTCLKCKGTGRIAAHPSPTPASDEDRVRPSLWWNAEDWEVTRCDLEDAYEDATQGEMRGVAKIGNAHEFDPIYAVRIDIDTTGDGEADDYEIKTFPTKEEADAYLADALKSTAAKGGRDGEM